MAGHKRPINGEDAYAPEIKRHMISARRDGQKNSTTLLSKSVANENHHGTQKPVVIDLSGEDENLASNPMQSPMAIMKPLPPHSVTGDFPIFHNGAVYIIIDPERTNYQYRLHKSILSRASPMLAKGLQLYCSKEAMEKLKDANTTAEARFDLKYSDKHRKWILSRTPFTIWNQPPGRVKAATVESMAKAACSSITLSNGISSQVLDATSQIESGNYKDIAATPSVFTPGILANQITIISVTKEIGNNLSENTINAISVASQGVESSVEHDIEGKLTSSNENSCTLDECASAIPSDGGHASVDQSPIELDVASETDEVKSSLTKVEPNKPAIVLANTEDGEPVKKGAEETVVLISSSGNEKTLTTAPISEPENGGHQTDDQRSLTANIDLKDPSLGLPKFENSSITHAKYDNLGAIEPMSNLEITQLSTETISHQTISQHDVIPCPKPVAVNGPPTELCEAYNNLFLIFYSNPPVISTTSTSIALEQCETLIAISQPLQAVRVIRPYLANAIGRFGKQLYLAIAAQPIRWLGVSWILESAAIFKESVIHIVGRHMPRADSQINLPAYVPQPVRDLIIYKVRCLDQQRMDVNEQLFSSSIIVDSKTVTLSHVDTTILPTWLVVQIWRDWFCRQMAAVHRNPLITGQLYRTLAKSDDAYLKFSEVKASIEGIRNPVKVDPDELKEDLELLKNFARKAVKDLCENNSMVNVHEAGISYLTCTKIVDEELPWFEAE